MRFMVIVKASLESEAGMMPPKELFEAMGKFNEEMARAGVMLAGEGLLPSSSGARVSFRDGTATVTDGPFAEAKELVAGFWLLQVRSKEEAIEWARRCPGFVDAELEVRQVAEVTDFPEDLMSPETAEREQKLRDELAGR